MQGPTCWKGNKFGHIFKKSARSKSDEGHAAEAHFEEMDSNWSYGNDHMWQIVNDEVSGRRDASLQSADEESELSNTWLRIYQRAV